MYIFVIDDIDGKLHIYDAISIKPIDLDSIVKKVVMPNDRIIELKFIPELYKNRISKLWKEKREDTLFVKSKNILLKEILFPMTSNT